MVSIGELARRTGTTPRMLRHWEATGLLPPAATDPLTGRRSYDPAQEGRVQSIVALRANGFGLDAIRDLLDSGTDHDRLRAVLDARRSTVAAGGGRAPPPPRGGAGGGRRP
ncbi:MerR family transcriptional regulator, partial [Microbacterium sp.]|uniref:MerR family transcriptional regulator n=1 Tax=Microbacterium sp. TaxID=51671 RepID=UPI00391BE71A